MAMVCPQCLRSFDQQWNCPECGSRLQFDTAVGKADLADATSGPPEWQHTPWGRMAIGLILAQGLAFGLQHLLTAGFLATGEEASVWMTLWGLVLLHLVQGFGLLIGGAIAGAANQQGVLYGSLVGLLNGILFIVFQGQSGEVVTEIVLYGQPLLHMAFGALGGFLGTVIWRPVAPLQILAGDDSKALPIPTPSWTFLSGPVYLGRVFLGAAIIVVGVVWSNVILNWVVETSQGTLEVKSHLQSKLLGWEITALAVLFGAGFAGSNTFNGIKQGLCVGIGASLVLSGINLGSGKVTFEHAVFLVACIMTLSIAGGWFGASLFPPVFYGKRRKSLFAE